MKEPPNNGTPPGGPPTITDADILTQVTVLCLTEGRPPILQFPIENIPLTVELLVQGLRIATKLMVQEEGANQDMAVLMNSLLTSVGITAKALRSNVEVKEPSRILRPNVITMPFTKPPGR
jgi:hypothetical protein